MRINLAYVAETSSIPLLYSLLLADTAREA
jgi:hypothetical protein